MLLFVCGRPAGSGSLTLLGGFMGTVYGTNLLMVNIRFLLKTYLRRYPTVPHKYSCVCGGGTSYLFIAEGDCFKV